jgi:hypothetical protein
MTWEHVCLVRELELAPLQKLVLFALASRANAAGDAWPSIQRLRRDTGLSRRAVQIHLGRLVALGAISRDSHRGRSNQLRLTLERLSASRGLGEVESVDKLSQGAHVVRPPCAPHAQPLRISCAPPAHAVHPKLKEKFLLKKKEEDGQTGSTGG